MFENKYTLNFFFIDLKPGIRGHAPVLSSQFVIVPQVALLKTGVTV